MLAKISRNKNELKKMMLPTTKSSCIACTFCRGDPKDMKVQHSLPCLRRKMNDFRCVLIGNYKKIYVGAFTNTATVCLQLRFATILDIFFWCDCSFATSLCNNP